MSLNFLDSLANQSQRESLHHLIPSKPRQIPRGKRSFNAPLIAKMLLIETPASDRGHSNLPRLESRATQNEA